jgi:hypothetical protein
MSLLCKIGLHDYVAMNERELVTYPKRGPFDPRSDAERTFVEYMKVCSQCGHKTVMGCVFY